jgi:uncharacterized protein (DUF1800 family)
MVLFWHDHFATQFSVAKSVRRMSYQNRTFREHGLGPLRTLVWEVTRDPAMLEMLDGRQNRRNALNENYPRELMELFLLGVFSFDETEENYTQTDVTELTRALTGFQYDANDVGFFNSARWDTGSKTLFAGKPFQATGAIGVEDGSGNLLPPAQNAIDILFTHTDSAGNLTMPRFLGKKLWEYFAYPNPDAALIDEITADFRANGYVVRDLLRSLFTHDEFYSATAKTSSVKNPCEFLFSAMRALDAQSSHVLTPDKLEDMGMELFEPYGALRAAERQRLEQRPLVALLRPARRALQRRAGRRRRPLGDRRQAEAGEADPEGRRRRGRGRGRDPRAPRHRREDAAGDPSSADRLLRGHERLRRRRSAREKGARRRGAGAPDSRSQHPLRGKR